MGPIPRLPLETLLLPRALTLLWVVSVQGWASASSPYTEGMPYSMFMTPSTSIMLVPPALQNSGLGS